jgi:hypothetical protein
MTNSSTPDIASVEPATPIEPAVRSGDQRAVFRRAGGTVRDLVRHAPAEEFLLALRGMASRDLVLSDGRGVRR